MSVPTPPDPYRIKRIANKLEAAWRIDPEMTFQGLLMNLGPTDFYENLCPDEDLEKCLDTYLKDHSVSQWKS